MAVVLLASMAAAPALAQGVYRIVGPDGRVTFSDQPPPAAASTPPVSTSGTGASSTSGGSQLPYELRQVASRYPVTLYTSAECAPCNSGRIMLNARGIPYAEKTVTTAQDSEALKRLSGGASLPFLTIGGQQIKGYSDTEWNQFLTAAGYPKQSALPRSYRQPAPTPLVAAVPVDKPEPGKTSKNGLSTAPAPTPVPVEAPPGLRF